MGQSESRDSRDSRGSRVYYDVNDGRYYDGRVQYYTEAPRYEVKRDTYEFWNTVDGRVRTSLGSRQLDYVDRPISGSFRQYEAVEAPIARIIEPPRPISSSVPLYGAPILPVTQTLSAPIPISTVPTYSTPYVQPVTYLPPAPVSYYPGAIYASR